MGRRTGAGAMLVPRVLWVLALWSLFAGVWIEWPFCMNVRIFVLIKLF